MSIYTHTLRGQESEAVADLPDLSLPSSEAQKEVAAGTDGKPVEDDKDKADKWTPELTPTTFSGCDWSSAVGNDQDRTQENHNEHNCRKSGKLDSENDRLATVGTGKKEKPTVGFEPTTTGLQNQSSTVELRWHEPENEVSGSLSRPSVYDR